MMDKDNRIRLAENFLHKMGYALGFSLPTRGVDLIVFEKGNGNKAIFVVVMDAAGKGSIPMQGLGTTKKAYARSSALLKGSTRWIKEVGWKGDIQFDAIWICPDKWISHGVNIGIHI